jgi:hypothetical protein
MGRENRRIWRHFAWLACLVRGPEQDTGSANDAPVDIFNFGTCTSGLNWRERYSHGQNRAANPALP